MVTKNTSLRHYEHLIWENPTRFIIVRVSNEHKYKRWQKFWLRMFGNNSDLFDNTLSIKCLVRDVKILRFSDITNFDSWALCDSSYYKPLLTTNNNSENFENALRLMREVYKDFNKNEIVQVVYFEKIIKTK